MLKKFKAILNIIIILLFVLLVCIPWESIFDSQIHLSRALENSSIQHPLGTDNLGRDLLVRISLAIRHVIIPMWIMICIGSVISFIIFYLHLKMMFSKILKPIVFILYITILIILSIPSSIFILFLAILFEVFFNNFTLLTISVLLSLRLYVELINLYNKDKNLLYWIAHKSYGGSLIHRIINYGVLKSWKTKILNIMDFNFKASILIESALSYLGFGIQEPSPSLGNILASHLDLYFKDHYYILILVSLTLIMCTLTPKCIFQTAHIMYSYLYSNNK